MATMSDQTNSPAPEDYKNRRQYPRFKVAVPVEIDAEGSDIPVHAATADLSQGGCYVETMFPLPKGAVLDLKLDLENTLLIAAVVVTCDPQVGNGIMFTKMLPEDREELQRFLQKVEEGQKSV